MTVHTKLVLLKIMHTIIWLFFNIVIFFLYVAIANKIDKWVWMCIGLIALEGLVLLLLKCLHANVVGKKYAGSQKDNFDIYVPNWLAKYNKTVYTAIVFIAVLILIYQLFF